MEMREVLNPFKNSNNTLKMLSTSFIIYFFVDHYLFFVLDLLLDSDSIGYKSKNSKAVNFSLNFFFIGHIFTSTIEELFFRLGIVFSKTNSRFFFMGTLFTIMAIIIPYESFTDRTTLFIFTGFLVVGFVLIWLLTNKYNENLRVFWMLNKKAIFIFSMIIFSLGHIRNYSITDNLTAVFSLPIILFPYLFAGYYYGWIRMRFGIISSISIHILSNIFTSTLQIYGVI